ncbi:MAG: efflux RND transporter permease subunit [Alphaproteobacteria bacterium]|nr:efflux RND transporter permease subunit [Alphaproteobacteria bacterium]
MKNNWAQWAIKNKQIVYFFAVLIVLAGVISYVKLGRQEDPEVPVKQMVVFASWPGATAKQMEQQVTDKIEKTVQTVADVDFITSYSRAGTCVVNVQLKEKTPGSVVNQRWQDIRNLVNGIRQNLPAELYGPYFDDHFDDVYGNVYAITSESFSYEDMRKIASKIKDQFVLIHDVKKVELLGVQPEKIYIQIDNTKLSQLGMSIDCLAQIIKEETSVFATPLMYNGKSNYYLRLTGIPNTVESIEKIPIGESERTLRLGDIAKIKRHYSEPEEPKMYFNGMPAIGIAVSMEDGGNNLKLGESLDKKIEEIRKNMPLGFELHQVLNQPKVVKNAINEFMKSLIEAILIVLLVSLLTLGKRSGYVVSACIPLVLLCSFIGMYLMGIDLHKISLGSLIISLGMLVDDSVVVIEMIEVKINEGWDRLKACSYAFESCAKPLLIGTLITCISFMPIAFAKSSTGEFAGCLFPVITITLMSSWVISATVAPVLSYSWMLPKNNYDSNNETNKDVSLYRQGFYKYFRYVLKWSLAHRMTIIVITIMFFIGSLFLSSILKKEFFPASVRPELLVEMNLPEGTSLAASDAAAKKLTKMVLNEKEDVASISTYVGKSCPRFVLVLDPVQPRDNYAQMVVVAKNFEARDRLEKKIKLLVNTYFPEVQSYSRSIPLGPPTPYPVMIRVSAPTAGQAKEYAEKLKHVMLQNPNITMVRFDWMEKSPTVKIEIDNDRLRQMGLTRQTVATALYAEVNGYTISKYYEGDQAIDIVFRLEPRNHDSISDLGNLSIPTAQGIVQLNQVARLSYDGEDGMIWRRNLLPTITVNAGIVDGVTGNDVTWQIMDSVRDLQKNLPTGVVIEAGGPTEKSVETLETLLRPVPMMFVIMLILLMIMLQDVRKMLVVLCTFPLGLIGVILGLFLFNTPLGIMAEIGALALVGTIIRNSTVLVDQIDQHLQQGMTVYQSVTESVIVRFRPIILTAVTTVLGLIPLFPSDFWRGLAVAISSGLMLATLITLIVLPVLYCIVFKVENEN